MTVVSKCVSVVKGITAMAVLMLALSTVAQAQQSQPDEFHVGDRIAITIQAPQYVSDTSIVREGLILSLPKLNLADISLVGVKRADIQTYLTQQIGKYIKDPVVHATALVRIAVLGQVMRPGFYTVPSDVLLSDVVMSAGGPTGQADLNRAVIKRDGKEVITEERIASALTSGLTLDQLQIAPGDQFVVGEKPTSKWSTILKVVGVVVPIVSLAIYLKNSN